MRRAAASADDRPRCAMLSSSCTPGQEAGSRASSSSCVRIGGVLLPQRDRAAGARAGQRQGRAPCAAADDRDVMKGISARSSCGRLQPWISNFVYEAQRDCRKSSDCVTGP